MQQQKIIQLIFKLYFSFHFQFSPLFPPLSPHALPSWLITVFLLDFFFSFLKKMIRLSVCSLERTFASIQFCFSPRFSAVFRWKGLRINDFLQLRPSVVAPHRLGFHFHFFSVPRQQHIEFYPVLSIFLIVVSLRLVFPFRSFSAFRETEWRRIFFVKNIGSARTPLRGKKKSRKWTCDQKNVSVAWLARFFFSCFGFSVALPHGVSEAASLSLLFPRIFTKNFTIRFGLTLPLPREDIICLVISNLSNLQQSETRARHYRNIKYLVQDLFYFQERYQNFSMLLIAQWIFPLLSKSWDIFIGYIMDHYRRFYHFYGISPIKPIVTILTARPLTMEKFWNIVTKLDFVSYF